jgi:hypothetical protein
VAGRGRVAVGRWSLTVDPVGGSRSRKGPEPMELVVPVTVVEAENAELWRRLGASSTNSSASVEEFDQAMAKRPHQPRSSHSKDIRTGKPRQIGFAHANPTPFRDRKRNAPKFLP